MGKKNVTSLSIQLDSELGKMLEECAKKEKRTKRAVVELALEDYFSKSPAFENKKGGNK